MAATRRPASHDRRALVVLGNSPGPEQSQCVPYPAAGAEIVAGGHAVRKFVTSIVSDSDEATSVLAVIRQAVGNGAASEEPVYPPSVENAGWLISEANVVPAARVSLRVRIPVPGSETRSGH